MVDHWLAAEPRVPKNAGCDEADLQKGDPASSRGRVVWINGTRVSADRLGLLPLSGFRKGSARAVGNRVSYTPTLTLFTLREMATDAGLEVATLNGVSPGSARSTLRSENTSVIESASAVIVASWKSTPIRSAHDAARGKSQTISIPG